MQMDPASKVIIREVALRDGLQSENIYVSTEDKLDLIKALSEAGVEYLETTSFVNPKAIPQLKDAANLMAYVDRSGPMKHEVMVPNFTGAQLALESEPDRLMVFVSASEAHNQANVRRTVSESLADLQAIFEIAKEKSVPVAGVIAVAFGCPYQGKVDETDVLKIARYFVKCGADRISLADTTGMGTPKQISKMVSFFKQELSDVTICLHLHNNRGVAMANLYAGYLAGISMFDTSLGGIGGCPNVPQAAGNLATEDVVFMFEEMGVNTGMDLSKLIKAAQALEKILQHPLPGQVMKSGPADPLLAHELCNIGR